MRLFLVTSLLAAACGDEPPAPCWPTELPSPEATVELGTGSSADLDVFAPLPTSLAFISGGQSVGIPLHARMKDLAPGDATSTDGPDNPRMKVTAFDDQGTAFGQECPSTFGFVGGGDGWFYRSRRYYFTLRIDEAIPLYSKNVRFVAEIIDAEERYAVSTVTIMLQPPPVE